MKTIYTQFFVKFYALAFLSAFVFTNLNAQISHNVSTSGTSFLPNNLTITVGDEVVWTNTGGNHNVNGTKTTFSSNPESFGNNVGAGWTYKFTFNSTGTYDYQCDPHASLGMTGKIIVNAKNTTAIEIHDSPLAVNFQVYPNPATQYIELIIPAGSRPLNTVKFYSISGNLVKEIVFSGKSESLPCDVSNFRNGIYFMEINSGNRKDVLKFLKE